MSSVLRLHRHLVCVSRLMSVSKKKCAKCAKSDGSLRACSNCHLVSYCGRACQLSDWPKHKVSCRLNSNITVVFNFVSDYHEGGLSTMHTGTPRLDHIFDVLTGVEQETAIAELIERIKEQRRVCNDSNDFFGIAGHCLGLCSIYVKMKHFTEAEIEINRSTRYVKKIDVLIANDPIAQSNPDLKQLRQSIDWNRLMVETPLLTVANESEMHDVEQMPMGPERRERTYAVVKTLFQEQNNSLKIANLNQCFKIDLHCICIIHAIDNEESGNLVKTRKLFENRMAHAKSMISEHGQELDKESVDTFQNFQWGSDLLKAMQ